MVTVYDRTSSLAVKQSSSQHQLSIYLPTHPSQLSSHLSNPESKDSSITSHHITSHHNIPPHHSKPPKPTRYLPLSHPFPSFPIPPCKHNFPYYLDKTKQTKPNQIKSNLQSTQISYIYIYTIFNFLLR